MVGVIGTQTFDEAQAATSYSWMWSLSRSCLRNRPPRTGRRRTAPKGGDASVDGVGQLTGGPGGPPRYLDGIWEDALPDLHAAEQDIVAAGDTVSVRYVVEATHEADLLGIAPTGRRVRWDALDIYRLRTG